jgi:hypothetical protein
MAAEGAQVVIADLAAEHAEVVAGQVRDCGGQTLELVPVQPTGAGR